MDSWHCCQVRKRRRAAALQDAAAPFAHPIAFALHAMKPHLPIFALGMLVTAALHAGDDITPSELDLATVLRLAGARSLDVELAKEKLKEAEARYDSATWQFFPWL